MSHIYKLTQEGYEKIFSELKELKSKGRKKAVDRLAKARAMGDLSENSEYVAAKEGLSFVDGKIQELEAIVENVLIINKKKKENSIQIGSTVSVDRGGKKEEFKVVGEMEADISKGHISDNSPLGKALLGKKKGAEISVNVPAGKIEYKILSIK